MSSAAGQVYLGKRERQGERGDGVVSARMVELVQFVDVLHAYIHVCMYVCMCGVQGRHAADFC